MSEHDENLTEGVDESTAMPPGSEENDTGMREKGKKRSTIWVIGIFAGMLAISAYVLTRGDGGEPMPSTGSSGGAEIRGEAREAERNDLDTEMGGVGRERADVLQEIEEREDFQDRLERGESAVRFAPPEIVEPEPEPEEEPAPVFGDVEPREPKRSTPPASTSAPMTNTPSAIRPQPRSIPQDGQQNNMINPEKVAYEMEALMASKETGAHRYIEYTQYNPDAVSQADGGAQAQASAPSRASIGLDGDATQSGAEGSTEVGSIAMPGDILSAYSMNTVSSDQPSGIARADILEGELKGARLLGQANIEGERIIINYTQMVYDDKVYEINALAVDPETMQTSMQDGINRRLMTRYGVPLAVGIASIGLDYQAEKINPSVTEINADGEQVTRRSNQTSSFGEHMTVNATDTLDRPLSDLASNAASTPIHVWSDPGVIGVMFASPVPAE